MSAARPDSSTNPQRDLASAPLLSRSTVALALVAAASCGGAELGIEGEGSVAEAPKAIVNGTPHQGHPAVGIVTTGDGLCTATLVGKQTVVTAAHCVTPGRTHYFVIGQKPFIASEVHQHPQYDNYANNDVAVVVLRNAPPVKPAGISTVAPSLGQKLTLLGYGATSGAGAGSGLKRIGSNVVAHLTSTRIVISGSGGDRSNLCFGDSGGPTFALFDGKELQVGIHSTIAGECGLQGHDMRVDAYSDWIRQVADGDLSADGKLSPLLDDQAPEVSVVSPADGAEVPWRLAVTAEVRDNEEVARAELLVDGELAHEIVGGGPIFEFPKLELSPGEHRITVVGHDTADNRAERSITVVALEPLPFGEPCADSDACGSELCVTHPSAGKYCSQLCDPDGEPCPDGASCVPAGGESHACGPTPQLLSNNEDLESIPPSEAGSPGERNATTSSDAGGCAVGGDHRITTTASGTHTLPILLTLLGLLARQRRRRS